MYIQIKTVNNRKIAVINDTKILFTDAQSALDLIATVHYETGSDRIVLSKDVVAENFFILSTGLAGEFLQKFINYQMKLAIYGDFSEYTSKPLKDFIYESNHGKNVFFVASKEEAMTKISGQ